MIISFIFRYFKSIEYIIPKIFSTFQLNPYLFNHSANFHRSIIETNDAQVIRLTWNCIIQLMETNEFNFQVKQKIAKWFEPKKSIDWIYVLLQSNVQLDRKTALNLLISLTT